MWARIEEGRCVEFVTHNPQGRYPADLTWAKVPEHLVPYADTTFVVDGDGVPQPGDLEAFKDSLKEAVAGRRFLAQQMGTVHEGLRYHGDNSSLAVMETTISTGTRYEAIHGVGSFAVTWKGRDGFALLTLTELAEATNAVARFVQRCFVREEEICTMLDQCSTAEGLYNVFITEYASCWPGDACDDGSVGASGTTA